MWKEEQTNTIILLLFFLVFRNFEHIEWNEDKLHELRQSNKIENPKRKKKQHLK